MEAEATIINRPTRPNEPRSPARPRRPGVEYGTYDYDGATITGNIVRDDNLDCGLGDGTGGFSSSTVTVADNVSTFDDGDGDIVSFDRVETSIPISFDMTQLRASSEMSYNLCPGVLGDFAAGEL